MDVERYKVRQLEIANAYGGSIEKDAWAS